MHRSHARRLTAIPLAVLAALLAGSLQPAGAQIVFDGNLVWNNGNNTLAGQYVGAAGAGVAACPGLTTFDVATSRYVENTLADPLLAAALSIAAPGFQPAAGSPAFAGNAPHGKAVNVPADGFFTQVCFTGAVGPGPGDDWTQGWTYYDSLGTTRDDLHLPGMTDPRPVAILDNVSLYSNYSMAPDTNYLVRGTLRVKGGARLTVPAGVVIFGERSTLGTIVVERGAHIDARGTAADPIIMTSDDPPGSQVRGGWGGLWLLGRALCNCANTAAGDSCASEGGAIGHFGGGDDADSSGVLRYVRVEYSGFPISPDNELNCFTFDGVGSRTVLEYLQAHRGDDDLFEFFGGTARAKYLVGTDGNDDGFDWQMGYRGKAQFVIVRQLADGAQTDKAIEADNNEFDFDTPNGPRSNAVLANATFIGDRRSGAGFPGITHGVHLRRGTRGSVLNSIIYNWKSSAFRIEHDATWAAACAAGFARPGLFCGQGTTDAAPLAQGSWLVARSAPNPFTSSLAISFTLPEAGRVQVRLYAADGRLVRELVDGELPAGPHSLRWQADSGLPSGMYFYSVQAGGRQAAGKAIRID